MEESKKIKDVCNEANNCILELVVESEGYLDIEDRAAIEGLYLLCKNVLKVNDARLVFEDWKEVVGEP